MNNAVPMKDILTRTREKLAAYVQSRANLLNTFYFGTKEWEEFEEFARRNWCVHIKSHNKHYLAGVEIRKSTLPQGIYTVGEHKDALEYQAEKEGE